MSIKIQIYSIIISFIYGYFFSRVLDYNLNFVKRYNKIWQIIINIVFINNFAIFYVWLLYKINGGIFHYYFIMSLVGGLLLSIRRKRKVILNK